MSLQIRQVTAAETFPLRQRVLRPHETVDELARRWDGDSDPCHFAAVESGTVIGSASVGRESPTWAADSSVSWRLRGMATAEDRRGEGVGAALLAAVIDHVRQCGGGLLWCNARMAAVSLYQRAGFTTRGDGWDDPNLGPHIAMELLVDPASR
ncbi:MAG TPA: GNAT family N-acetyltransferase [Acidimicrobiia bacterium]|nr:GNAT family N-acetyltransferase [Acidimicrobiia bacterium]